MLDNTDHDEILTLYIKQASEAVMNFYKYETVPAEWELGTSPQTYAVPQWAQYATQAVVGRMFFNREATEEVLNKAIRDLIPRTPTIA